MKDDTVSLIKPATSEGKRPPGLFHVIVEISDDENNFYWLLPVTDRMIQLESAGEQNRYSSLKQVASAIATLDENIKVYAADQNIFLPGSRRIRPLTAYEIEHLRRLINPD